MNKSNVLEQIGRLPVVEQVQLAESVLHKLGNRLRRLSSDRPARQDDLKMRLAKAAIEAQDYHRTDPDVQLWTSLDGESVEN